MKNFYAHIGHVMYYPVMFKEQPGLSFNAYISNTEVDLLLMGVRYCNGRVYPAANRSAGGRFYDAVFVDKGIAEAIFSGLREHCSSEYPDLFTGVEMSSAIKGIVMNRRTVIRYIPELADTRLNDEQAEVAGSVN